MAMRILLRNLLDNTVRYTSKQGQVLINLSLDGGKLALTVGFRQHKAKPVIGSSQMIHGCASRQAVTYSREKRKNAEAVPASKATRPAMRHDLPI